LFPLLTGGGGIVWYTMSDVLYTVKNYLEISMSQFCPKIKKSQNKTNLNETVKNSSITIKHLYLILTFARVGQNKV